MMTFEERSARIDSVHQLVQAVLIKQGVLGKQADKLRAYNTLLEPPTTVKLANEAHIKRLEEERREAWELYEKLDKIHDKLWAMPAMYTYTSDYGEERSFVSKGLLPNCEETSEDEAEAMAMLDAYYAAKATA